MQQFDLANFGSLPILIPVNLPLFFSRALFVGSVAKGLIGGKSAHADPFALAADFDFHRSGVDFRNDSRHGGSPPGGTKINLVRSNIFRRRETSIERMPFQKENGRRV
jgi:hypothetical protein